MALLNRFSLEVQLKQLLPIVSKSEDFIAYMYAYVKPDGNVAVQNGETFLCMVMHIPEFVGLCDETFGVPLKALHRTIVGQKKYKEIDISVDKDSLAFITKTPTHFSSLPITINDSTVNIKQIEYTPKSNSWKSPPLTLSWMFKVALNTVLPVSDIARGVEFCSVCWGPSGVISTNRQCITWCPDNSTFTITPDTEILIPQEIAAKVVAMGDPEHFAIENNMIYFSYGKLGHIASPLLVGTFPERWRDYYSFGENEDDTAENCIILSRGIKAQLKLVGKFAEKTARDQAMFARLKVTEEKPNSMSVSFVDNIKTIQEIVVIDNPYKCTFDIKLNASQLANFLLTCDRMYVHSTANISNEPVKRHIIHLTVEDQSVKIIMAIEPYDD